jgi:ATP-dependent DNA helicase RecG
LQYNRNFGSILTAEEIKSLANSGKGYNVEFKLKLPGKVRELSEEVCAFANSEGGFLLIGINDKGQIIGNTIDNPKLSAIQNSIREISPAINVDIYSVDIDGKSVWVIEVPSGKDKPYVLSGAIYLRESANTQKLTTAEEIRSFFQSSNRIYFDAVPCLKFDFEKELDNDTFNLFRSESGIFGNISTHQILNNLQVFDDSGEVNYPPTPTAMRWASGFIDLCFIAEVLFESPPV